MPARFATYLDINAGTPLHENVKRALVPLLSPPEASPGGLSSFHVFPSNPSSIHAHGREARRLTLQAREKVARSLRPDAKPEEVIFTSSGTEANQLAIASVLEPLLFEGKRPHWITTAVEHDSTMQMIDWARARGVDVSVLPVDQDGGYRMDVLDSLLKPETALVSALWVNNETGVIADVKALSERVKAHGALLHLDAAQAWGKIPLQVMAVDFLAFSGHKIGALPGSGVLWVRPGVRVTPRMLGKQERGLRGGTENLLAIVALGAAAETLDPVAWAESVGPLRDRLEAEILRLVPGAIINGRGTKRVANTLNLSIPGKRGDELVMALDLAGYSVSAGSACASGSTEPSHVLIAMGRNEQDARSALRVSLPLGLQWEELERFAGVLKRIASS